MDTSILTYIFAGIILICLGVAIYLNDKREREKERLRREKEEREQWRILYENGRRWTIRMRDPDYGKYDTVDEFMDVVNVWKVKLEYSPVLHQYRQVLICETDDLKEIENYSNAKQRAEKYIVDETIPMVIISPPHTK
jgi:hypothetical protein